MITRPLRTRAVWRVDILEHQVARWRIPAQSIEVHAVDEVQARIEATRRAHVAAGCPPWKPLLRMTYLRTAATRVEVAA